MYRLSGSHSVSWPFGVAVKRQMAGPYKNLTNIQYTPVFVERVTKPLLIESYLVDLSTGSPMPLMWTGGTK